MPSIQADFSKISTEFTPLPDGIYTCTIEDITEEKTKQNQLPMLKFELSVSDPNHPDYEDRKLFDNIVLRTNKGKPNQIGLGQLKAYAIATLGEEAANGGEIDTDAMKGSQVGVEVKTRSYKPEGEDEPRLVNEIKKIHPVG